MHSTSVNRASGTEGGGLEPATDSTVSLLPLASHGDSQAASILLGRMRPFLKRVGHGKLPGWARARVETEDLVQESLIRALKHIPRFQGQSVRDFRNWLQTVFRNLVIDETRYVTRVGVGQELPDSVRDDALSPEEQLAEQETADAFEAALKRLCKTDRLFVVYRLQHGYSFQELADRMGKPSADAARMMGGEG